VEAEARTIAGETTMGVGTIPKVLVATVLIGLGVYSLASNSEVRTHFLWQQPIAPAAVEQTEELSRPNRALYDLQERCGRRAEQVFEKNYERFSKDDKTYTIRNYQNHYNHTLNKCFFLVIETTHFNSTKEQLRMLELLDLNDNSRYGLYIGLTKQDSHTTCEVRGRDCSSEPEWVDLANRYLED
jgi:hypothetical protein